MKDGNTWKIKAVHVEASNGVRCGVKLCFPEAKV